jgi:hypothetical protein
MKINQIVGEHKKGFKAKIYQKKQTVAPTKPLKANEIEHPSQVKEAQVTPATVSAVDQNTGEVKLKNPDGTETNMAPDAMQKGPDGKLVAKVATAKPGDQVNIEKEMEEEFDIKGMLGLNTPEEWAKTSKQMAALLAMRTQYPNNAELEKRISDLQFRLNQGNGEVMDYDSKTGQTFPKKPMPPKQFNTNELKEKSETHVDDKIFAGTAVGQKAGVAGQARAMTKAPLKGKLVGASESLSASDKALLEKMLTIAGLR